MPAGMYSNKFSQPIGKYISHSYWFNFWNCTFSGPTGIYLFEFSNNNSRKRCEICSKLTIETAERRQWRSSDVFTVICAGKSRTEYKQQNPNTRKKQYYRTLNLSICFRVGYRSPVIFTMKLFVTTVNSHHPLANFWRKGLNLAWCIGLEVNIVKWSANILKGIEGHPTMLGAT